MGFSEEIKNAKNGAEVMAIWNKHRTVNNIGPDPEEIPPTIIVESMDDGHNVKCPRCWHWHGVIENFGHLPEDIEANPKLAKEKLCDRCQKIILTHFPNHPSVPHIKAALEYQRKKYTLDITCLI